MGKQAFLSQLNKGKQKEVEILGESFIVRAPSLIQYEEIASAERPDGTYDFSMLAKVVIANVYDTETEKKYFTKGDFDTLMKDRSGAVQELSAEIMGLMIPDEKEQEETKKK